MLSNYGNERITRIRLGRDPLSSVVLFLLNIFFDYYLNNLNLVSSYD